MLPVCSATTCSSCHSQIPIHGVLRPLSRYSSKVVLNFSNGVQLARASFKRQPVSCFYSNYNGLGPNGIIFVDNSSNSAADDQVTDFIAKINDPESYTSTIGLPADPPPAIDLNSLPDQEINVTDIISDLKESTADTINGVQSVLNESFDTITSSLKTSLEKANQTVDNAINDIFSFINKSGDSAGNKLTGLSGDLKEASGKAGFVALDLLRGVIVIVENSLVKGFETVGYAYSSTKEFLPQDFRETLSLSEDSVVKVLRPVGTTLQQVYIFVEGVEERLGLDPNDPLIPFVLLLGVSATLWGSYRVLKYSGYAGDLSPQSTMELLRGNEKVVLVDIRPENLRERDGIPDLRRTARSRYVSITIPEVDGSVKKLLKGGRDIEDSLLAAVIRNLKNVEGRSKVLIMDADGTRSKGVARSLRKLGTKNAYLVQGGFRSWVEEGFRIKMLKPETALTILNEDAEAILEELNPTPLKLVGLGVGFVAAVYSFAEWEKTLQFIGVIGLGQTIYRRVASYQDAEDFKQDVSLLLAPVRLGGEAISWTAGKLDTKKGNGLPTSPSSTDVQSRVLQAAAKHESQPEEETQDSLSSTNESVKVSEA